MDQTSTRGKAHQWHFDWSPTYVNQVIIMQFYRVDFLDIFCAMRHIMWSKFSSSSDVSTPWVKKRATKLFVMSLLIKTPLIDFQNSFAGTLGEKSAIRLPLKSHRALTASLHYRVKHEWCKLAFCVLSLDELPETGVWQTAIGPMEKELCSVSSILTPAGSSNNTDIV